MGQIDENIIVIIILVMHITACMILIVGLPQFETTYIILGCVPCGKFPHPVKSNMSVEGDGRKRKDVGRVVTHIVAPAVCLWK